MPLILPTGKRLALAIGVDFEAQCAFPDLDGRYTPAGISRGDFDVRVGSPRLLQLFKRHSVPTTWFLPANTIATFPDMARDIFDAGHEIAAHGVHTERLTGLDEAEERRLLELQLSRHESLFGIRPRGYRAPGWDLSARSLDLLVEYGFGWESSLMGDDFFPYRPRNVVVHPESANALGEPVGLVEFPVSWFLNDFPSLDHVPSSVPGLQPVSALLRTWLDTFNFAYANAPSGLVNLTLHGMTSGRAHAFTMLEQFLTHALERKDVWLCTLSEAKDTWVD